MSGPEWGSYSYDLQNGPVIDMMMRVWVTYPWGHPVIISDISRHCDTFSTTGPFGVTCHLEDDGEGITADDVIELKYRVNGGDITSVPMVEMTTIGDGVFGADISSDFSVGDEIAYWIYTLDDAGLENDTYYEAVNFEITEPENPDADLLLLSEGGYSIASYSQTLDDLGLEYEHFDMTAGIDEYIVDWGWQSIIIVGWGVNNLPPATGLNPFTGFLDNGGNLCLIDQDWFYANAYPDSGVFEAGDFAYDYFGLTGYYNFPENAEAIYYGGEGDPVTGDFFNEPFETYFDGYPHHEDYNFRADYLIAGNGNEVFLGIEDGRCYGVKHQTSNYKTLFLSFLAEAANEFYVDSVAVSDDFQMLITNICDWFEIPYTGIESKPSQSVAEFTLHQNYPNPFNAETTISFNLAVKGEVKITVYNIYGQLVETLSDGRENAGYHQVKWEAGDLASGIYICKLETESEYLTRKMLLLK